MGQVKTPVIVVQSRLAAGYPSAAIPLKRSHGPGTFSGEEAADEFRLIMKVNRTGCRYCMPCPAGVSIPGCCFNTCNSQ